MLVHSSMLKHTRAIHVMFYKQPEKNIWPHKTTSKFMHIFWTLFWTPPAAPLILLKSYLDSHSVQNKLLEKLFLSLVLWFSFALKKVFRAHQQTKYFWPSLACKSLETKLKLRNVLSKHIGHEYLLFIWWLLKEPFFFGWTCFNSQKLGLAALSP